jgi:O-antigen ligase
MLVNLFFYSPSVKEVVTNTQSNFTTSGGFGPNQVSTMLGLGMFIAFTQLLLASKTKTLQIVNSILVVLFAFRCIVTFSRGGMITGLLMILVLIIVLYRITTTRAKGKIIVMTGATVLAGLLIWGYTSFQTSGLIDKRYANENTLGIKKESNFSGREVLAESELEIFLSNPFLGIGVGKNKEVRAEETGISAASHNEMTRMLAEHGSLGLVAFLILLVTPLILYMENKYQIFALIFTIFWLLTINHAAMRIAAPAFIYSLALLKVRFTEEQNADM